jgi:hypothetical protein
VVQTEGHIRLVSYPNLTYVGILSKHELGELGSTYSVKNGATAHFIRRIK